jgi:hypothetical protein
MRLFFGPLLLQLGFLAAGLGVLRAAGMIRTVWSLETLAAAGLAYLLGIVAVLMGAVTLLVLGLPFTIATIALLMLAFTALLGPGALRDPPFHRLAHLPRVGALWRRVRGAQAENVALWVTLALFVILAGVGLFAVTDHPIGGSEYDAWNLWARKANLLFLGSHLPAAVFRSPGEGYIQSYYPLLLPLLEASQMVEWLLMVGWVFAGIYLCRRVTRAAAAAAVFCGVAVLLIPVVVTSYADVPSAMFLSLGVLALGVWLQQNRRADLVVATILLVGATNVKNEGAVGAVAALVAAAGALWFAHERGRLRALGAATVAFVVIGVLPWRIWLAANGIHGDHSFGKSFDIPFLVENRSRVWPAIKSLVSQIQPDGFDPRLFVAIGLAVALSALVTRYGRRAVASYYLTAGVLYFVGLLWGYWTSPFTGSLYEAQVFTTVGRITIGLGLIGVAAVLQLGGLHPAEPGGRPEALDTGREAP